jgi:hypothetical protein
MALHTNTVFAPLDRDLAMERIGGGNETEVYRTDDGRFVVKVKEDLGGTPTDAFVQAHTLRAAAEVFADCLGPYSLPNYYVVATDSDQRAQVLTVQPFAGPAKPLFDLDYAALSPEQRASIAEQLRDIIRRSLRLYKTTGKMPDLYGRASHSSAERSRMRSIWMLPHRMWSFLVLRNLLRSHNLMAVMHPGEAPQIVLVDYDPVRRSELYRRIYYLVRWLLFFRDHALILLMKRGADIPRAR